MLPLIAAGIGAGLLKSQFIDKPKEERQRRLAAETQRLSPWTGMQAGPIQEADPFGSALQMGTTGAMLGQGIQGMENQQAITDAQVGLADSQKSTYGKMMNGNSLNAANSISTMPSANFGFQKQRTPYHLMKE